MITRKCLRASAAARRGESSQVMLMKEGEKARRQGKTTIDCPYIGDDRDCWLDGFNDTEIVK